MMKVLDLIEEMLGTLVDGGDDMIPVEHVSRIRRVCQTQKEMLEQGLIE